ncbi:MAG: hypothetical protein OEV41_13800 [Gammaproteobacteria bacterium]|nr:hypothetical protein [Gammaproteobacteria bacterium]
MSTTSTSARRRFVLLAIIAPSLTVAETMSYDFTGHSKTRFLADAFPDDSAFHALTGSSASSLENELRMNFSAGSGAWTFDTAWQLYAGYGDRIELGRELAGTALPGIGHLPSDDRRLMNLTDVMQDDGKLVALHRLDRLAVTFARDKLVVRAGRQAITWGNGLAFTPMDIVNPFDPTAIDTEYKAGDDMLYVQYLRSNGDDVEFAQVFRRDPVTGDATSDVATTAAKYHGFVGETEYDLLLARNYGETTIGIGGNRSLGGAVLHGDVVWVDTPSGGRFQVVANLSYSWTWGGKNVSGLVEYYFSAFGQHAGHYDLAGLAGNPELIGRLQRGESFTLGRNYLVAGLGIEMTPLWMLTPNLFANLDDGSALMQLVTRRSLGDNTEFLAAVNLPIGPGGTEFGGIEAGVPGVYLSTDFSLFAQFAWYF